MASCHSWTEKVDATNDLQGDLADVCKGAGEETGYAVHNAEEMGKGCNGPNLQAFGKAPHNKGLCQIFEARKRGLCTVNCKRA